MSGPNNDEHFKKSSNFSPVKVTHLQANSGRIDINRVIIKYPAYKASGVDNPNLRPSALSF